MPYNYDSDWDYFDALKAEDREIPEYQIETELMYEDY